MLFLKKHLPIFILSTILIGLAVLASDTAYLTIELTGYKRNYIQVFWTGKDGKYSLKKLAGDVTRKGRNTYVLQLKDALFIDNVRVDLQQGRKGNIPPPVSLHRMSLEFKWLFLGRSFDNLLEDVDQVWGMEMPGNSDEPDMLVFTDPDPRFEFRMDMQPLYHQLFLPFVFILILHSFIYGYLVRRSENIYLLDIELISSQDDLLHFLMEMLQSNNLQHKIVKTSAAHKLSRILLQINCRSIAELFPVVSALKNNPHVTKVYVANSGNGGV